MTIGMLAWFKSSYSDGGGGDCVEIAAAWFKSSHSDEEGAECVEIAALPQAIHIRDSKHQHGPRLAVPAAAWAHFVSHAGTR
ncbi:DUF397 domain-containing protein [Streptomyces sp. NPDC002537]